jgi:ketosteroid isomerase-like protein
MRIIVALVLAFTTLGLAPALAEAKCPRGLQKRAIDQVVADHQAAMAAGDWEAVACNYARRAFVIDDQGVLVGAEEIVTALMSLHALAAGAPAVILEAIYFGEVARVLYRLDAGWFKIEDGVHTYRIRKGRIEFQTTHGLITFTGPPPD